MITLASDFGSPYPAAMRGVLLAESGAKLVDIAHDFPRQDPRAGAFWLREVLPFFPPAVHLVVIDPGVGTGRRVLVAEAGEHRLVGPDNGVLIPAAERLDPDPTYYVTAPEDPASSTFHGRDVFAPLAAAIHESGLPAVVAADRFETTTDVERIDFPEPTVEGREAIGEVLVVDDFGNAITNVPGTYLDSLDANELLVDGLAAPIVTAYAEVPPGQRLVTVGSHGNVELSVNRGRGEAAFGLAPGDTVYLAPVDDGSTDR
ncbi:MAG: S-adenosyl-l-methionine hydroxide adenosyltransferase family protein [Halodesulfurarchaeum sp.]